eukprot:1102014-Pyramimonas_sp.AAC.1
MASLLLVAGASLAPVKLLSELSRTCPTKRSSISLNLKASRRSTPSLASSPSVNDVGSNSACEMLCRVLSGLASDPLCAARNAEPLPSSEPTRPRSQMFSEM